MRGPHFAAPVSAAALVGLWGPRSCALWQASQDYTMRGQGDRPLLLLSCPGQLAAQRLSPAGAFDLLIATLNLLAGRGVGWNSPGQEAAQFVQQLFGMKDIAVARQVSPRGPLAGPQGHAPVGNRIVGI